MIFRISAAVALVVSASSAADAAQVPPRDSLQIDPQQGATPRVPPIERPVDATQGSRNDVSFPVIGITPTQVDLLTPPPAIRYREPEVTLDSADALLPSPVVDPLNIDRSTDPVLALAEGTVEPEAFAMAVRKGVRAHPGFAEARADRGEAEAQRNEARALALPTIDLNLTYFRVIDRAFSNDPENILERSRPRERTDAQVQITAPAFDFGRTFARINSAEARLAASDANIEDYTLRLAQSSIASWYQVFSYRALVRLGEAFVANQDELHAALKKRVDQGLSAQADLLIYDSYRAAAQAQLADFRRQLNASEAQYSVYIGEAAPENLGRAPPARQVGMTSDALLTTIDTLPAVVRARRLTRAARYDTQAAKAQLLPSVSLGMVAGRYGVFETDRDYDIRASVTLSQRLFGGGKQRADQAQAREQRAQATYDRVHLEAERDLTIAASDVASLEQASGALRDNYFASRQARDALFERFRLSRGTLNDVLTAQTNYYNVAVRYVTTISELDIARYVLLARTGQLLSALGIDSAGDRLND